MSECYKNSEEQLGETDEGGSEKEWVCMQADLETIEAISQEAQERELSIDEYFLRSCKNYEKRKTTR